jgi:endonuclease III
MSEQPKDLLDEVVDTIEQATEQDTPVPEVTMDSLTTAIDKLLHVVIEQGLKVKQHQIHIKNLLEGYANIVQLVQVHRNTLKQLIKDLAMLSEKVENFDARVDVVADWVKQERDARKKAES